MTGRSVGSQAVQKASPVLAGLLTACSGPQSMLDPAGPVAREAAMLWWPMLIFSVLVLAVVAALWLVAMRRRPGPAESGHAARIGQRWIVGGGIVLPAASATVLLAFGIPAGQRMLAPSAGEALIIDVVARQWQWQVRYPDYAIVLVDELHLPVGRPVEIRIGSDDVIHSFWVPRLGRKIDAIPGRINVLRLAADRAGSMRGQCSEFCGRGHAHMALRVEVHEAADFSAWLAHQTRAVR